MRGTHTCCLMRLQSDRIHGLNYFWGLWHLEKENNWYRFEKSKNWSWSWSRFRPLEGHQFKENRKQRYVPIVCAGCIMFERSPVLETSDAGSQYCCGRVGRGSQPPSTPNAPPNPPFQPKHIHKNVLKGLFSHFSTRAHGATDPRTDGWTKPLIGVRVRN